MLRATHRLIELIYACAIDETSVPILLREMSDAFDVESASLAYVDPVHPGADFTLSHGVIADPVAQARYQDFAAIDPAPAAMSSLKLGRAASTDLVFSKTMDRFTPFLEGYLHPLGLGGALAGIVARGDARTGFFVLHRGRDRRIFDEADIDDFEVLLPHVAKMLTIRKAFFALEDKIDAVGHTADPISVAMMSLDDEGRLVYANALSRTVLARGDGLYLDRFGGLKALDTTANGLLEGMWHGAAAADLVVRVPRASSHVPYGLRLRRMEGSPRLRASRGYSVYVSDPIRKFEGIQAAVASAMGLTNACAKLVCALLDGETLDGFASASGLSRSTAKFHLRSAFAATGTRRQVDLLRIAGRVACDLMLTYPPGDDRD